MRKMLLARCLRWNLGIVLVVFGVVALTTILLRFSVVMLAQHRTDLELWLSKSVGHPVTIGSAKANWRNADPGISFGDVILKSDQQNSFIAIKQLTVSIDILRSLFYWKPIPGEISISGVQLDVDQQGDHFQIRGVLASHQIRALSTHDTQLTDLMSWMIARGNVDIEDASVNLHLANGESYGLSRLSFHLNNNWITHRIDGNAEFTNSPNTKILFTARLKDIEYHHAKFNAAMYFRIQKIPLSTWIASSWIKPYLHDFSLKNGSADLELWGSWKKTNLSDVVGRLHLDQVKTHVSASHVPLNVDSLIAEFKWWPLKSSLYFTVKKSVFSLPEQYRHSIYLNQLKTKIEWHKEQSGLTFYSPDYYLKLNDLTSKGAFQLKLPREGEGLAELNLLSCFRIHHLRNLKAFFPDSNRADSSSHWLSQAFSQGEIPEITLAYRGLLVKDALEGHRSHLSANAIVKNASLSYYYNWPILSSLNAHVWVDNRKIMANFKRPRLESNQFEWIHATVDDFLKPTLSLKAVLHSDLKNITDFFHHSPLASNELVDASLAKKPVDLSFTFGMDFSKNGYPVKANGILKTFDSSANFGLQTTAETLALDVNGQLNASELIHLASDPMVSGISGKTPYQTKLEMDLVKRHSKKLHAQFNSDLTGVRIAGLPDFFNKAAITPTPLSLDYDSFWGKPSELVLHYRKDVYMRLLANTDAGFKLLNGQVFVGTAPILRKDSLRGFYINGKMDYFNWGTWKPYIMPLIHEKDGALDIPEIAGQPLRYVELQFKKLDAYHQTISDLNFKLIPRKEDWLFKMDSPEITGDIYLPNHSGGTWSGELIHLNIPKLPNSKDKKKRQPMNIDPRKIPPIDIDVKQLKYGSTNYGHLILRARHIATGLLINTFSIDSSLFRLMMKGKWQQAALHQKTSIQGHFETPDLGFFLESMEIKDSVEKGKGFSDFSLNWDDAPDQLEDKKLNGEISFDFHHGHILKMDQSKAQGLQLARLVNAFSLEDLPRRLTLHFGDITAKGLEFRKLKGVIKIDHGHATLDNALIDGPVAKLLISGKVNFLGKYYDLDVSVAPYVTSSVPLIIGIAGGPIAGAVAWAVNKLATPEIGKMIGFVYHARGSWDTSKDAALPKPTATNTQQKPIKSMPS